MSQTETISKSTVRSYLSFKLGEEIFAANVEKVVNILEMCKITKVPKSPVYMKGVINLRGVVLPVVDTRIKFEMEEKENTTNTCILVLEVMANGKKITVGAIVDAVQEVLELKDEQLQPAPNIGSSYKSEFISAVVQHNEEFIMILDMDLIFTGADLNILKQHYEETI